MEEEKALKKVEEIRKEKMYSKWIVYDIIFFVMCEIFVLLEFKTDSIVLPVLLLAVVAIFATTLIIRERDRQLSNYLWLISLIVSVIIIGYISFKIVNVFEDYTTRDSYIEYNVK